MNPVILTNQLIDDFAAWLREEEKSPHTVEKYLRDVRAFMLFADGRPLSKELAVAYKQTLLEQDRHRKTSINSMLASVNSFLVFAGRPDCKVTNLRIQKSPYCPEERNLTKAEYVRLKEAAKDRPWLYLILETLFATGIRISELRYFTVEALQGNTITVSCKNKMRIILVPKELRKKLLSYAKQKGIESGVIFRTRGGNPVNRSNVWAEMKKLCIRAGVSKSKVFPHNIRKLFARLYYGLSKDLSQLADLLGHSSINTTRIYIMTTENEVRGMVERMERMVLAEEKKKNHIIGIM